MAAAALAFSMAACGNSATGQKVGSFISDSAASAIEAQSDSESKNASDPNNGASAYTVLAASVEYKDSDYYEDYTAKEYTTVVLSGSSASVSGKNASKVKTADGTVTITGKGYYVLEGNYEGTVLIDAPEDEKVHLVLNGVTVKGQTGPAIYEKCSDKLIVMLVSGTVNNLSDAVTYADTSEDSADACLYATDDLTVNGEGTLNIAGNYKAGIKTKDDLKIMSGIINVTAADDALKGHDSLSVAGGVITVSAGDDGLHSDGNVVIDNGTVNVLKSVEAVEGLTITVNAGTVNVIASDDGFNATDGSGSQFGGGNFTGFRGNKTGNVQGSSAASDQKQESPTEATVTPTIFINGGEIFINSNGDGLDANGNIEMNGGCVYVSGATNDGNNATDYDGTFIMNGGNLTASGMSGMYQSISSGSSCYVIDYTDQSLIEAGTEVLLKDGDTVIYSFTVAKKADSLLLTGDKLEKGKEYTLKIGGESVTVTAGEGSGRSGFGGFGDRGSFGGQMPEGGGFGGQRPEGGNFGGQRPEGGNFGDRMPENGDFNGNFGGPKPEGSNDNRQ